jgi:hypothetical protein
MRGDKPVKLVLEATDSTWSFLLVSISLEHVCEGASGCDQLHGNARSSSWYFVHRIRPAQVVVVAVVIDVGVDDVGFSPKFGGKLAGGALQTHNTITDQPSALIFKSHACKPRKRRTTVRLTSSHPKRPHCSPRPFLQPTSPPSA